MRIRIFSKTYFIYEKLITRLIFIFKHFEKTYPFLSSNFHLSLLVICICYVRNINERSVAPWEYLRITGALFLRPTCCCENTEIRNSEPKTLWIYIVFSVNSSEKFESFWPRNYLCFSKFIRSVKTRKFEFLAYRRLNWQ